MSNNFRVLHYPQIPCEPYIVKAENIKEAIKIKDTLGDYDLFQLEYKIKPDYCNMTIIECYDEGYKEWYSLDDYDIEGILEEFELVASK